jgi:hypothetical protein
LHGVSAEFYTHHRTETLRLLQLLQIPVRWGQYLLSQLENKRHSCFLYFCCISVQQWSIYQSKNLTLLPPSAHPISVADPDRDQHGSAFNSAPRFGSGAIYLKNYCRKLKFLFLAKFYCTWHGTYLSEIYVRAKLLLIYYAK